MESTSNQTHHSRPIARWPTARPCPVCGGWPSLPRGRGTRCAGFLSSNSRFAYCTREEYAGPLLPSFRTSPPAYRHRLAGACDCGANHGQR
jgi:hypothetical protein